MKNTIRTLIIVFFTTFFLTSIYAQQAIVTSGVNASGSGGSVSYSVGQVVYTTNTGINGSVAQGVQQPYEISVIIGLDEAKGINLSFSTYPNPTNDFLILKVGDFKFENLMCQLYDLNGQLIESKKVENIETKISMEKLTPAIYFLKIIQESKDVKTFKIIKNQ